MLMLSITEGYPSLTGAHILLTHTPSALTELHLSQISLLFLKVRNKGDDMNGELMVLQVTEQGGGHNNQVPFSLQFLIQPELLLIITAPPEPSLATMAA